MGTRKLFVSPHNDDAVLFGAYTLMREKPLVLTVYDSYYQPRMLGVPQANAANRRVEDQEAVGMLGCDVEFGGLNDIEVIEGAVLVALSKYADRCDEVWIPAVEDGGNRHHNLVGRIGLCLFTHHIIHRYYTYTEHGKSTKGTPVPHDGPMVERKLRAMLCYRSQLMNSRLNCWQHFARGLDEFAV